MKKSLWIIPLLIVIFLPQLFGWFGQSFYRWFLGNQLGGQWEMHSLSCQWYGTQKATNVIWKQDDEVILKAKQIQMKGFFPLLFGFTESRFFEIDEGEVHLNEGQVSGFNPLKYPQVRINALTVFVKDEKLVIDSFLWSPEKIDLKGKNLVTNTPFIFRYDPQIIQAQLSLPTVYLDQLVGSDLPTQMIGERFELMIDPKKEGFNLNFSSPLSSIVSYGSFDSNELKFSKWQSQLHLPPTLLKAFSKHLPSLEPTTLRTDFTDLVLDRRYWKIKQINSSSVLDHLVMSNLDQTVDAGKINCRVTLQEELKIDCFNKADNFVVQWNVEPFKLESHLEIPILFSYKSAQTVKLNLEGVINKKIQLISKIRSKNLHFLNEITGKSLKKLYVKSTGKGEVLNVPFEFDATSVGKLKPFIALSQIKGSASTRRGRINFKGASGNQFHKATLDHTFVILQSDDFDFFETDEVKARAHAIYQGDQDRIVSKTTFFDKTRFGKKQLGQCLVKADHVFNEGFLSEKLTWHLQANAARFPTRALPSDFMLVKQGFAWVDWDFKGTYQNNEKPLKLNGTIKGEGLDFKGSLQSINRDFVEGKGAIDLLINQKRYNSLVRYFYPEKTPMFSMTYAPQFQGELKQFRFNIQNPSWCEFSALGEATFSDMVLTHIRSGQKIKTEKIQMDFEVEQGFERVHFASEGKIFTSILPLKEDPHYQIKIEGKELCSNQKVSLSQGSLSIKGEGKLLPMPALVELIPIDTYQKEAMISFFGDLMSCSISGQLDKLSGHLDCHLQSTNAKIALPFRLSDGLLTLMHDAKGEVMLTDQINYWLADIVPFLPNKAHSKNPVYFYIKEEGFSMQLIPFSFNSLKVESGAVDFGQIEVANTGNLQEMFKFLKIPSHQETIEVWLTPIFFQIADGAVHYKRFDLLVNREIPLALWGGINLNNDQIRMTLALPSKILRKYFKLLALSKNTYFLIQIKGTTENPRLDWSQAYARMAMLVTRLAGGYIGYFVGGIVEQALGLNDEKVPAPTTEPFPWVTQEVRNPKFFPPYSNKPEKKGSSLERAFKFLIP